LSLLLRVGGERENAERQQGGREPAQTFPP
jgi:hypothetical protein